MPEGMTDARARAVLDAKEKREREEAEAAERLRIAEMEATGRAREAAAAARLKAELEEAEQALAVLRSVERSLQEVPEPAWQRCCGNDPSYFVARLAVAAERRLAFLQGTEPPRQSPEERDAALLAANVRPI
jgi:hypothetical protein